MTASTALAFCTIESLSKETMVSGNCLQFLYISITHTTQHPVGADCEPMEWYCTGGTNQSKAHAWIHMEKWTNKLSRVNKPKETNCATMLHPIHSAETLNAFRFITVIFKSQLFSSPLEEDLLSAISRPCVYRVCNNDISIRAGSKWPSAAQNKAQR